MKCIIKIGSYGEKNILSQMVEKNINFKKQEDGEYLLVELEMTEIEKLSRICIYFVYFDYIKDEKGSFVTNPKNLSKLDLLKENLKYLKMGDFYSIDENNTCYFKESYVFAGSTYDRKLSEYINTDEDLSPFLFIKILFDVMINPNSRFISHAECSVQDYLDIALECDVLNEFEKNQFASFHTCVSREFRETVYPNLIKDISEHIIEHDKVPEFIRNEHFKIVPEYFGECNFKYFIENEIMRAEIILFLFDSMKFNYSCESNYSSELVEIRVCGQEFTIRTKEKLLHDNHLTRTSKDKMISDIKVMKEKMILLLGEISSFNDFEYLVEKIRKDNSFDNLKSYYEYTRKYEKIGVNNMFIPGFTISGKSDLTWCGSFKCWELFLTKEDAEKITGEKQMSEQDCHKESVDKLNEITDNKEKILFILKEFDFDPWEMEIEKFETVPIDYELREDKNILAITWGCRHESNEVEFYDLDDENNKKCLLSDLEWCVEKLGENHGLS